MKVFVAGLPFDMDGQELKEIFEDYGPVNSANIISDRETGKSRGFGFIDFLEKSSAENAIARLDGGELEGRRLTVQPASAPGHHKTSGEKNFREDRSRERRN